MNIMEELMSEGMESTMSSLGIMIDMINKQDSYFEGIAIFKKKLVDALEKQGFSREESLSMANNINFK